MTTCIPYMSGDTKSPPERVGANEAYSHWFNKAKKKTAKWLSF